MDFIKNKREAVTSAASRQPQGLKPASLLPLYAALKRRSSTLRPAEAPLPR
jgi:hypothetical protein